MSRARVFAPLLAFVLAASPAFAQDEDEDAPSRPARREKEPQVQGRNDALKAAFKDVAAKASSFIVRVGKDAYGVVLEGNLVVTTAAAAKDRSEVAVKGNGLSGSARVIGVDDANAIALLEAPSDAKGIELGKSSDLSVGQFVVIVGPSKDPLAVGVLSAKDRKVEPRDLGASMGLMGLMSDGIDGPKRSYPKVLQHDAPMTDDTLGTALVDSKGRLVGMNVGTGYRGSSYAIAVDDLSQCVKALKDGKSAPALTRPEKTDGEKPAKDDDDKPAPPPATGKPYLGVNVDPALGVDEVAAGSPAEKAGFAKGDKILSVDGTKLESLDQLADYLGAKKPGDKVVFTVRRGRASREVTVKLGSK